MTTFSTWSTLCLHCTAPVDLLDVGGLGDRKPALYRDVTRWCGVCMRSMDDRERFCRLYQPRVRQFCWKLLQVSLPDNEDCWWLADDIAQETMITALEHFEVWEKPERAIWNTARRKIYKKCDAYRLVTKGGFPLTVRHVEPAAPDTAGEETVADPADAVVDRVVLYSEISRLPLPIQQAVIAHTALNIPAAKAGRLLKRPPSTVKTQAQRGLGMLREAAAVAAFLTTLCVGIFLLYTILEHLPLDTVADKAEGLLTHPVFLVVAGPFVRYGIDYLRNLFRGFRGHGEAPEEDVRSRKDRHRKDRHRGES
ncbi:sigma-70 family RNA polymerase sigma factor [Streptomyces sp. NBC_00868]|uniref:RNA polymerase sigma factor n=2 Tax=Streptomyces TaxID=1883 RepID=UPI00325061F5|nr:sigma-70 family RNA polymerase sigma factor [Streptomyces sp. NBC_00868]